MAPPFRLPSMLHGVPARLGAVFLVASVCGWSLWPRAEVPAVPPTMTMDGKNGDRLAFAGGDETDIPVRDSRIYDTIAMFAQPQVEPRPWSEAPIRATVAEAGIRPVPLRPAETRRLAARPETRPARTASTDTTRSSTKTREASAVSVFGWDIPGSQHLPSGRDAARAFDRVGDGAVAIGSGTVQVVSSVGNGVARAGHAIAATLGL